MRKSRQECMDFILSDMKENGGQASWDWPADERFAEFLDCDTLISAAMNSCAPSPLRIAASSTWSKITNKRIRTLRELVSMGKVDAFWVGTGPGGKDQFGVGRIRTYELRE